MDNFNYREFIYGQSLFNSEEDEKQQLNENAPGYDNRKFGEALPTLESVKAAHEAKEKEEINEGDLFSSEFDRPHLKDIIRDLNKGLILDMPTRRAYKFLVSLLDKEDKEELGLNENKEDDDRIISAAEANMVNRLRYQVMMLDKGHIDKDDFINAVEEIAFDKIKEQEK